MLSESAAAETAVTIFRIWSLSFFVLSPVTSADRASDSLVRLRALTRGWISARARPLDDAVHLPFGFWSVAADHAPGGGDIRGVPVSDNLWDGLSFWLISAADLYHRRPTGATPPADEKPISQALDG